MTFKGGFFTLLVILVIEEMISSIGQYHLGLLKSITSMEDVRGILIRCSAVWMVNPFSLSVRKIAETGPTA